MNPLPRCASAVMLILALTLATDPGRAGTPVGRRENLTAALEARRMQTPGEMRAPSREAALSASAPDGAGGTIVAWVEARSGSYPSNLYVQRLNASEVPQWTTNGVQLCTTPALDFAVVSDGSGGAIVVWTDQRGVDRIYAQRVNASGATQWTDNGVGIGTSLNYAWSPTAISDGVGGAVVAWLDGAAGVRAQRLNGAGSAQWDVNGVVLSAAGLVVLPGIVPDGAGGAIVAWVDYRNGNPDIFARRVSAGGVPQWTADGVAICAEGSYQQYSALTPDGAGGAIVTWVDQRGIDQDIYAQRVDATGAPLWTADGVPVCAATGYQQFPDIVSDGAGGAILAWQDGRDGDLYAQRLGANGAPQWTLDGVPLGVPPVAGNPLIVPDGAGGVIAAWVDYRHWTGLTPYNTDIYAQRVSSAGATLWASGGVELCTAPGGQSGLRIVADGAGGVIVAWDDVRSLWDVDCYAQRIDASGAVQWATDGVGVNVAGAQKLPASAVTQGGVIVAWQEKRGGEYDILARKFDVSGSPQWPVVPVCTSPGSQALPRVVSDGAGGAIVLWQTEQPATASLFIQRLNAAGARVWGTDGVSLSTGQFPRLVPDGAGGAIVTWADARITAGEPDVYAQRVDAAGVPQWTADGAVVCSAAGMQEGPCLVPDGTGGAIFAWRDWRTDSGIYVQRLDAAGVPQWDADGMPLGLSPYLDYPCIASDGAGGGIVAWAAEMDLVSYDVFAQRVDASGTQRWGAGGAVVSAAAENQQSPAVAADGAGGAICMWTDFSSTTPGLYAQRLDSNGTARWNAGGVALYGAGGSQWATLAPDLAGGAIVAWSDLRNDTDWNLRAQRVDAAGTTQWIADGVGVCTVPRAQELPTMVPDGSGGVILAWQDGRDGINDYIYSQRLDANGALLWNVDGVTSTELSLLSADVEPQRVRLVWLASDGASVLATVYRRTRTSAWSALGQAARDGTGRLEYDDRQVSMGTRYGYRLGFREAGIERFTAETWVDVPASLEFALDGLRPNPAVGELRASFSLAHAGDVRLALLDIAGRAVLTRDFNTLAPGRHVMQLASAGAVKPGVYWLKLTQANNAKVQRAVVVR